MLVHFRCPRCKKALKAPAAMSGKSSPCPNCKTLVQIPREQAASEPVVPIAPVSSTESWDDSDIYPLAKVPSTPASTGLPAWGGSAIATPTGLPASSASGAPRPFEKPPDSDLRELPVLRYVPNRYVYWLFALSLFPLVISMFGSKDDIEERLTKTIAAHPELQSKFNENELPTKDALLSKLPGGRIEGALLPYNSNAHWGYAMISAAAFFSLIWFTFYHGNATPKQILCVGLATATFGILFLIAVQWLAEVSQHFNMMGGNVVILLLFYLVKFIGFAYHAALNPDSGFLLSFVGFTFGVGFCEELTKGLPVIFSIRAGRDLDCRGACMWGLASGIGFGLAEAILYSSSQYNGLAAGGLYFVRFISCVGLHAIWGASVAIMAWRRRNWLQSDNDWSDLLISLLYILGIPMLLHGLYDALLKYNMEGGAILVALASFVWLTVLSESNSLKKFPALSS
jgi:RsiW-degrading membrane proteinase PrsW (M82 family)